MVADSFMRQFRSTYHDFVELGIDCDISLDPSRGFFAVFCNRKGKGGYDETVELVSRPEPDKPIVHRSWKILVDDANDLQDSLESIAEELMEELTKHG